MNSETSMRLRGKVALLTGAAQGIGYAIAAAFAQEGTQIAAVDINDAGLRKAVQKIDALSQQVQPLEADVTQAADVERMVKETLDRFGRIDVLVNNAGVTDKAHRQIKDLPKEIWDRVLSVNLTGTFLCCRAVISHMMQQKAGSIINISSLLGLKGEAREGDGPYCASKFGIEGLTEVLSKELKPYGINVNSLAPATQVDTGFFDHLPDHERKKLARPEIMGEPAVFLASLTPGSLSGRYIHAKRWHEEQEYREALMEEHESFL